MGDRSFIFGGNMLAADNLLKTLSNNETANYKNENEDYDLGEVLRFFSDGINTTHKLRYDDGHEEFFSFE